jgi:hypothetical protein
MSAVIRVLEELGRNPSLSVACDEKYFASVSAPALDAAQRRALLGGDMEALNALVGGRNTMRCLIATPE